jgi:23S rRNA pseudouridine1911/1915/1917 synthase
MSVAGPAAPVPLVLFEDQHLIVLDKPPGLLSQGEHRGEPNIVDWLRERLGRPYVGLIHRLDRNTSGIMIVAKRTKAAQRLTKSLQDGSLERVYLGWVHGRLTAPARWSHVLLKDERTNTVKVLSSDVAERSKQAVLRARPVAWGVWRGMPLTLVEFKLETGRSHQIRAQASAEGHPLLGDVKYARNDTPAASRQFGRPALHSSRIRFPHPMGAAVLEFEAPLPGDMAAIKRDGE